MHCDEKPKAYRDLVARMYTSSLIRNQRRYIYDKVTLGFDIVAPLEAQPPGYSSPDSAPDDEKFAEEFLASGGKPPTTPGGRNPPGGETLPPGHIKGSADKPIKTCPVPAAARPHKKPRSKYS